MAKQRKNVPPDKVKTPTAASTPPATPPAPTAVSGTPTLRRWVFRGLALTAVPLLLLAGLEVILWLINYGDPTPFFLRTRIEGRPVYIENQRFGRRFFPPALVRHPQPCVVDARKEPGTKRIFVLGESAAMGDPEPAFGLGRVLEVLLRERYPRTRFEVVNVSITAINSHVLLPIARDCAAREGDVWVVYMGNNEVVGPYGAGTVFSQKTPPLWLIRLNVALKATRVGRLLASGLSRSGGGDATPKVWGGMEMFLKQTVRHDDPRMARVYAHFERNLRDILALGRRSGAKVVVSSLGANLRDCAPFASLNRSDLSADALAAWKQEYESGTRYQATNDFANALACYDRAAKIDAEYADLAYRRGRCLLALGRAAEAGPALREALDYDGLRFRPDRRIQEILRRTAAGKDSGVAFADAAAALAAQAPDGLPGDDLLYEHVHPTFEGNYWIGRALAEQVAGVLGPLPEAKPQWASWGECQERLAATAWDRFQALEIMVKRMQEPPFTQQSDWAERNRRWQEQLARLRPLTKPNALRQSADLYQRELVRWPNDIYLRANAARLYQTLGEDDTAVTQWQETLRRAPHHSAACYALGSLLDSKGRAGEAQFYFQEAIRLRPESPDALNALGACLARQGKPNEAMHCYQQAIAINPESAEPYVNLGLLYAELGQPDAAKEQYLAALKSRPNSPSAHINLGSLLGRQGRWEEAAEHYRAAMDALPEDPISRFNLANTLVKLGRWPEAERFYQSALELKPALTEARLNYGLGLAERGQTAEALRQFSEAVQRDPQHVDARNNLGVTYAKMKRWNEAIAQFEEALRLSPNDEQARQNLESARKLRER